MSMCRPRLLSQMVYTIGMSSEGVSEVFVSVPVECQGGYVMTLQEMLGLG